MDTCSSGFAGVDYGQGLEAFSIRVAPPAFYGLRIGCMINGLIMRSTIVFNTARYLQHKTALLAHVDVVCVYRVIICGAAPGRQGRRGRAEPGPRKRRPRDCRARV